jgi:hypothetical protein
MTAMPQMKRHAGECKHFGFTAERIAAGLMIFLSHCPIRIRKALPKRCLWPIVLQNLSAGSPKTGNIRIRKAGIFESDFSLET